MADRPPAAAAPSALGRIIGRPIKHLWIHPQALAKLLVAAVLVEVAWRAAFYSLTGVHAQETPEKPPAGDYPDLPPLRAYDCEHPEARWRMIDLTEPGECPDTIKDYSDPNPGRLQIVQRGFQRTITATQCIVNVARDATFCGFDGLTYTTEPVHDFRPARDMNDVQVCRVQSEAFKQYGGWIPGPQPDFGTLVGEKDPDGRYALLRLEKLGQWGDHSVVEYGSITNDGQRTCTGKAFTLNGRDYDSHYVIAKYRYVLREVQGTHDLITGKVVFDMGLLADFSSGSVEYDTEFGTVFWDTTEPTCQEKHSSLYVGPADIHFKYSTLNNPLADRHYGAIVMVANAVSHQYAGMVLKDSVKICGRHCYETHAEGLLACVLRMEDDPVVAKFRPDIPQHDIQLQAQLGHLYLHQLLQNQGRFEEVQEQLCELDQRLTHTQLTQMSGGQNPYTLVHKYGPGHVTTVAGSTAYLTDCVPVNVTIRNHRNCTEQVPIFDQNGEAAFMNSFTRTIQPLSPEIPCDDLMPVRWKLDDDQWYCSSPQLRHCEAPEKVNSSLAAFDLTDSGHGFPYKIGHSIYTREQQQAHKAAQGARRAREAIVALLAGQAARSRSRGSITGYLSTADLETIYDGVGYTFFPFFYIFGKAWTTFVGVLIVFTIVRIVAGCLWRMCILYSERGCGFYIIAGLWATAFSILRAPAGIFASVNRQAKYAAEELDAFLPRKRRERRGPPPDAGPGPTFAKANPKYPALPTTFDPTAPFGDGPSLAKRLENDPEEESGNYSTPSDLQPLRGRRSSNSQPLPTPGRALPGGRADPHSHLGSRTNLSHQ